MICPRGKLGLIERAVWSGELGEVLGAPWVLQESQTGCNLPEIASDS